MPAELDALLEDAIASVDAAAATGLAVASALNAIGYGTTTRLRTYDDNAFELAAPPRESIAKLRTELVNNGVTDDAESRAVVGALISKLVTQADRTAGHSTAGPGSNPAGGAATLVPTAKVKLGVTFPTINRWENGRAKPSPLALKQIEDLLRDLGEKGRDLLEAFFGEEA